MKKLISIFVFVGVFLFPLNDPVYSQVKEKPKEASLQKSEEQSQEQPLDIVLVLDNSGSMKKNDPEFLTREVVTNFVNGLGADSRLGMVIFDQEALLCRKLGDILYPPCQAFILL